MLSIDLNRFLIFWGVNTFSLWVADGLFDGIFFENYRILFVAGLLFGLVNTFLKPVLILLTLPLAVATLGFFLMVLNALMLLLVSWLVPGFTVAGFWNGFFAAMFITFFSFLVNGVVGYNKVTIRKFK